MPWPGAVHSNGSACRPSPSTRSTRSAACAQRVDRTAARRSVLPQDRHLPRAHRATRVARLSRAVAEHLLPARAGVVSPPVAPLGERVAGRAGRRLDGLRAATALSQRRHARARTSITSTPAGCRSKRRHARPGDGVRATGDDAASVRARRSARHPRQVRRRPGAGVRRSASRAGRARTARPRGDEILLSPAAAPYNNVLPMLFSPDSFKAARSTCRRTTSRRCRSRWCSRDSAPRSRRHSK